MDIGIKSHEESKTSVVDVFELSKNLRRDRHGIVCTLEHYNFIYQVSEIHWFVYFAVYSHIFITSWFFVVNVRFSAFITEQACFWPLTRKHAYHLVSQKFPVARNLMFVLCSSGSTGSFRHFRLSICLSVSD